MASEITYEGRKGWLRQNYETVKSVVSKYPHLISFSHSADYSQFTFRIRGQGRFSGSQLIISSYQPYPGLPPKFELLNKSEIGRLKHHHITEVYWCLKAPWTPNTPISVPLRAILHAWWKS